MTCDACGHVNPERPEFCFECGTETISDPEVPMILHERAVMSPVWYEPGA